MNAPLYTTEILRLAASLSEPHKLEREDGRAEVRSPTCGSRLTLAVQLDADGRVAAISQLVHACAFGQASAALLERGAGGRNHDDVSRVLADFTEWLAGANRAPDWPNLTALAPARSRRSRHGAMLLPFRALLAAIESAR
ncbi:MAG TPA: iron-sulfur cluster assembly scaffold protein [Sphingomicrobium sp.]|nr:iron-sulfur cluster assembly scaffold protein [Sphingomicrobium sp.]